MGENREIVDLDFMIVYVFIIKIHFVTIDTDLSFFSNDDEKIAER